MQIAIYPDTNTLSHQAAQHIIRIANESIVTRGRFSVSTRSAARPTLTQRRTLATFGRKGDR